MKILVVSHAAVVPGYRRKFELLAGKHSEITITLVTPEAWTEGGRRVQQEPLTVGPNFCVCPLPVILPGVQYGHCYPTLGSFMKGRKVDLLHIEEEPPSVVAAQVSGLKLRLCPDAKFLFFTWENQLPHWKGIRGHVYPRWERRTWTAADAAIAGTEKAKQVLSDRGFRKPIYAVPQVGIDIEQFSPAASKATRAAEDAMVIGYAGRLLREKGLDVLLKAFSRLDGGQLLIVGNGPDKTRLEDLARSLQIPQGRIEFHPAVPHEQMTDIYRKMDVFVLPSRSTPTWSEQFGRVMLEAMACGVPVVASRSGSIPEVVEDSAMLFPEGNADSLTECLRLLMENVPLRQAWGERGRRRVVSSFTDEHIAQSLWQTYSSLTNELPI